eukprot:TRINITY_DN67520_c7_g1_i1.p1 TRINITY_DN67520_c7_g1~~TRINITY_DN67520_c7_g1_i1.p1  ORF type:complete len:1113 (-),score=711.82 TRINITY_DN67520_c7_g1_i1:1833-5003(-)
MKVRAHPKTGPYVEGLQRIAVTCYKDVQHVMAKGTAARTVASTQMNDTSSRAHTIVQVVFTTTTFDEMTKKKSSKVSKINLVDLAGSERVSKTGATGARFKEGININKSLTVLGECINKLAKRAKKKKKVHVPYRDSVLTFLLMESLGGNSKTIMIAAISPASDNYEESLSTLRYADHAKQIQNAAKVNEDENAKMIKTLKAEIEALRSQLASQGINPAGAGGVAGGASLKGAVVDPKEHEELLVMRERMKQNEAIIQAMNKTWEEKMQESQAALKHSALAQAEEEKLRTSVPHLVNLHQDRLMAETLAYFFRDGETRICRADAQPPPREQRDVVLKGLMIQKEHAVVQNGGDGQSISIRPAADNARIFVNGQLVREPTELKHNDRVILGAHHTFRMVVPQAKSDEDAKFDWQFAQKEMNEAAMSSLAPVAVDPEVQRQKEEAERQVQELKKRMDEEKAKAAEEQEAKRQEYQKMVETMEQTRQKQLEQERKRIAEEQDQKMRARLAKELAAKEEALAKEREAARVEFLKQQEEMRRKSEELERKLRKQQKETEKLQRKHEIENRDKVLLEETLMQTIPMINEANDICGELKQNLRFTIKLMAKKTGDIDGFVEHTEVYVKVVDTSEDQQADGVVEVFWNHEQFAEKLFRMREIYNDFLEYDEISIPEGEDNPFELRDDGPQLIGQVQLLLEPIYYLFPIKQKTPILNYKGETRGQLDVELLPVPPSDGSDDDGGGGKNDGIGKLGSDDDEVMFLEDSIEELKDGVIELQLRIKSAMGLPPQFSSNVFCQYKFFLDDTEQKTVAQDVVSINPEIGYERTILIEAITNDLIEYLREKVLTIEVWGQPPRDEEKEEKKRKALNSNRFTSTMTPQELEEFDRIRNVLEQARDSDLISTHARNKSMALQLQDLVTSARAYRSATPSPSPGGGGRRMLGINEEDDEDDRKRRRRGDDDDDDDDGVSDTDLDEDVLANRTTTWVKRELLSDRRKIRKKKEEIVTLRSEVDKREQRIRELEEKLKTQKPDDDERAALEAKDKELQELKKKLANQKQSNACVIL